MKNPTSFLLILTVLLVLASCTSKYQVISFANTSNTYTFLLRYTGTEEYYLKPTSPIIKDLTFVFHSLTYNDFTFKIFDTNNHRFQVPQEGPFPVDPYKNYSFPIALSAVRFEYNENPFDFKIVRKINNATLFSTFDGEFIFSDFYLQISTEVDSDYTYGLGQRFNPKFRLGQGKWTIFNRDRGQVIDKGQGLQTYGYYPFYLQRENERFFHINYLRSSNAMDIIKQNKNNKHYLTYKVIGGIFDFRFFLGEQNVELTVQKFQTYLGRSAIPPFWSLGFHQCKWGYENVTYLQNVLQGYESNNIPLDTIWSDIDYMVDYEDFTIDESKFPLDRMKNITDRYHYIPIVDAGIKVNDGQGYIQGKARGVFVKDALGAELIGKVWPGPSVFVDFFHPNASTYWSDMLGLLYDKVKFSGIWLDMNEYANFNEYENFDGPYDPPSQITFDYSKDLPYNPGADSIESNTIPLNATHYQNRSEANVHAFAAFLETYATNLFLKSKGLRPFIISRSSTLGSNKYGFHWTGDNHANFQFLRTSIADNFLNQMWGFQMVGPDICGFGGDTNEELCSRWFQLGSLYTFARNHNDYSSRSQQPYALGDTVLKAAQQNLRLRYSLLKHYYSLFLNRRGIGTIFNPLFFIYPLDTNNYIDQIADTQFLIGNNLMAAPILEQGQTSRNVYFTTNNWFNLYSGGQYRPGTHRIENVKLTDKVPLFIRENTVILMQDASNVRSTKDLGNKFTVVGAFHFQQQRSNTTHKYYNAAGSHISLDDYDNDSKIDNCISHGCEYVFTLRLEISPSSKLIVLDVSYAGGLGLNGSIFIDKVVAHFDNGPITKVLAAPYEIKGPSQTIINLDSAEEKNLRLDEQ